MSANTVGSSTRACAASGVMPFRARSWYSASASSPRSGEAATSTTDSGGSLIPSASTAIGDHLAAAEHDRLGDPLVDHRLHRPQHLVVLAVGEHEAVVGWRRALWTTRCMTSRDGPRMRSSSSR